MNGFPVTPIGYVRSPIAKPVPPDEFKGIDCEINLFPGFIPAIEGLDQERSIMVLFWFHLSHGYSLKVHPRGDINRPLKGVFATCSPHRPNRIGLSCVRLLGTEGNRLFVRGLDAVDGTPVLDIKPCSFFLKTGDLSISGTGSEEN